MSNRKAIYKPGAMVAGDDLERRIAALEDRVRRLPVRQVGSNASGTYSVMTQTTHALAIGNVIRHNGTSWVKSQADTAANGVVGGVVIAVLSPDVFVMATGGYVAGLSGLTAGSVHYLSAATAGALTTTAAKYPATVILADSTSSGVLCICNLPFAEFDTCELTAKKRQFVAGPSY